jgi:small basic protein
MGPYEQVLHIFNFMAPAWGVALFGVLAARLLARGGLSLAYWSWLTQTLVNGILGSAVLAGGLVFWGVDGKMATYSALVIVCGTAQWLMCKGWRS